MIRNLDRAYFRAHRNEKWISVCFTDLEPKEAEETITNRPDEWLQSLYNHLSEAIQDIEHIFDPNDYYVDAIHKTIEEIESYSSWRIKVLMIYGLVRYLGNRFDLTTYEVEEDD